MTVVNIVQQEYNSSDQLVVDFYVALFRPDSERATQMVTDDVVYVIHGFMQYDGKDGLKKMVKDTEESGIKEFRVSNIVSSESNAALNGVVALQDGTEMQFCEFLTFTKKDGKHLIRRIDSYVIVAAD